jgi:hypothetical protein
MSFRKGAHTGRAESKDNTSYHQHYRPGLGNVGSYQVAGIPYVTGSGPTIASGSTMGYTFPSVSRHITVINRSNANVGLKVHFSEASNWDTNNHYITLDNFGDSVELDVKAERVYVTSKGSSGHVEIFAELTGIDADQMFSLSGVGIDS